MAVGVNVRVDASKALSELNDLEDKLDGVGVETVADAILRRAKAYSPVRTGRLKRSIRKGGTRRVRVVSADAPYAPYVEGPPLNRRFVERAVSEATSTVQNELEQDLKRALK